MNSTFKTSRAIFAYSSESLGVVMFSNVNGPLNVEIKPTTRLDPIVKVPDSE
jgi:hypothetical protein